mmetsp:Transcript_7002/g.13920  ORF Transcript_7002/g.13920 Transcript_7002/m.13920 type:complete len:228 (-) Transcript_7002:1930-2613(-)
MSGEGGVKKNPECVRVVVRCRPMSRKEVEDGRQRIVDMQCDCGEITVRNPEADPREPSKPFTFDQVYDWNSTQEHLFETTAQPIVDSVLTGYNGTVFAYGQTGTGKTHTMEGQWDPHEMRGIIPRAFNRIFERITDTHDQNFLVRASFLEIYNEEVRDLLAKDPKKQARVERRCRSRGICEGPYFLCREESGGDGTCFDGGKEESKCGGHSNEPRLVPVSFHLQHHY